MKINKNLNKVDTENLQKTSLMMTIAPNTRARKGGKDRGEVKVEYGGIVGEEGNADYGGMVQPSQKHVAPCVRMGWVDIGHEKFGNVGSVLSRHAGRSYTEGRRSSTL